MAFLRQEARVIEWFRIIEVAESVTEAGRSSYHLAGLLEPLADEVWIIDPTELRRLQHRVVETDRRDATALSWWAAKGALKPLWRPDRQVLERRELTRGRHQET